MELNEKITMLQKALDLDEDLTIDTELESLDEWDSLGVVSVMALIDKKFNKALTPNELQSCKTVNDLVAYMTEKE